MMNADMIWVILFELPNKLQWNLS